jgi:hypothetical protein
MTTLEPVAPPTTEASSTEADRQDMKDSFTEGKSRTQGKGATWVPTVVTIPEETPEETAAGPQAQEGPKPSQDGSRRPFILIVDEAPPEAIRVAGGGAISETAVDDSKGPSVCNDWRIPTDSSEEGTQEAQQHRGPTAAVLTPAEEEEAFIGPQVAKVARRARNNLKRKHRGKIRGFDRMNASPGLSPLRRFLLFSLGLVSFMGAGLSAGCFRNPWEGQWVGLRSTGAQASPSTDHAVPTLPWRREARTPSPNIKGTKRPWKYSADTSS